jgi:hypothetical protein
MTEPKVKATIHDGTQSGIIGAGTVNADSIAVAGTQFSGNTRIGTFVQGIDSATAAKISDQLNDISRVLTSIHKGTEQQEGDEHPAFQGAQHEAKRMCDLGREGDASRAFMDVLENEERFERERQEDRRRFRLRLLEEALVYDMRALSVEAGFAKLRLVAEISHPGDRHAQAKYLMSRASEYQGFGTTKGDKSALLIAVSVFSWLAKEAMNVDRK